VSGDGCLAPLTTHHDFASIILAKEIPMWIQTFFNFLMSTPTRRRPIRRGSPASRLSVEALEDRCLLSFGPAVSYSVGPQPQAVITGDFNNDSLLDLAVLNSRDTSGESSVSLLLGNASVTFQPAQFYAVEGRVNSLAVGDFNGDGKLDLVMVNEVNDVTVNIALGNGDGTFGPAVTVASGLVPTPPGSVLMGPPSVAVGDLNGDGKLDLVVPSGIRVTTYSGPYGNIYSDRNCANVLLGHGDGTFTSPATTYSGDGGLTTDRPAPVAVGDFNRDGKLDVVTAGEEGTSVLLGDGKGDLQLSAQQPPFGADATSLAVADLNGDGKLDVVVTYDPVSNDSTVWVLPGNGDGTFQTYQYFTAGAHASSVAIGDFNKDGKPDLAVAKASGVSVLLGNGDGTFQPELTYATGSGPSSVAVGDFNSDGFPDLAVANSISNNVSVLLNAKDWSVILPQASNFAVSGFPSPTIAGVAGSFTVTAKTASGITATNYTGTVHFSSSDSQAGLPANYTFTAADAGVHTFSATLKTAGTQSITVKDTTTASLTGTDGGITVKPGAASRFLLTAPSSVKAGVAFNLTITVQDAYGNVVTGYTGTIHFKSTDTTATLPANYTFTAADKGVHTFTGLVLRKKGNQKITITDTLNSSITGSVIENVV
jgi:hypothetical protein